MNRKVLILAAVLLAFASISAFSWGIGIQGGSDVVRGGELVLSLLSLTLLI